MFLVFTYKIKIIYKNNLNFWLLIYFNIYMVFDITDDNKFIIVKDANKLELNQLRLSLTRDLPSAYILSKIRPDLETKKCFMNNFGMIPIGLWLMVINICKQYGYACVFTDKFKTYISINQDFKYEDFKKYIENLFKDSDSFFPKDYQIESAYKALKYKKCCIEISTSGGKTLISYIIVKYMMSLGIKNILYIVPSIDLASQSAEKYYQYDGLIKSDTDYIIAELHSNLKKKEKELVDKCNILFATFQSLSRKKQDFFKRFEVLLIDETHHAGNTSLSKIINFCKNSKYVIGMTGTFPHESKYENLIIQSYIGPVVYRLTANDLINKEKFATPIYVIYDILNWATDNEKITLYNSRLSGSKTDDFSIGSKLLKEEQIFVNNSNKRMKYICDLVISSKKNSMVLFGDIKFNTGQKFYEYIKKNSDKNVYYCDGNTPSKNREYYKQQMEEDDTGNTIIVASIGTMGEGIDVKNLWNIFLINTAKSERLVRQICGRGLRTYPGKDKVLLFDFVDDLKYAPKGIRYKRENYLWKHGCERKKIYKEQNFPIFERKITL